MLTNLYLYYNNRKVWLSVCVLSVSQATGQYRAKRDTQSHNRTSRDCGSFKHKMLGGLTG